MFWFVKNFTVVLWLGYNTKVMADSTWHWPMVSTYIEILLLMHYFFLISPPRFTLLFYFTKITNVI